MNHETTLVFISLTYARFLSAATLQRAKAQHGIRVVVVLEEQYAESIPETVKDSIDEVRVLPCDDFLGTPGGFDYPALKAVVAEEKSRHPGRQIRLVCSEEFNVVSTGRLRRELGIQGPTDVNLELFRDKILMKSRLAAAGIRVPAFLRIHPADLAECNYGHLREQLGAEFIVKPVNGAGSSGVWHIRTKEDLDEFRHAWASEPMEYEAEEYIRGTLYHVDAIFAGGRSVFTAVSEYSCPNLEFTQGKVLASMALSPSEPLHSMLVSFAQRVHRVLEPSDFSTHMEVFVRDGMPIFLEIAARSPGALTSEAYLRSFGVNIMDIDLMVQSGLDVPIERVTPMPSFWACFPFVEGRVVERRRPELSCDFKMNWRVKVGDVLPRCKSVLDIAGTLVARHPDPQHLRREFDRLRDFASLTCQPADKVSHAGQNLPHASNDRREPQHGSVA